MAGRSLRSKQVLEEEGETIESEIVDLPCGQQMSLSEELPQELVTGEPAIIQCRPETKESNLTAGNKTINTGTYDVNSKKG
jgi:hypothetical protein